MKYKFAYLIIFCLEIIGCSKKYDTPYERFYIRSEGADLAIQVEGNVASGVIILLLHGGPGGNGLIYNVGEYSEILESNFGMAYLDQRGQGASQGKYGTDKVTVLQMAKDAAVVVKALKLKYGKHTRIYLMGHSWGGMIGTKALLDTDIGNNIEGWIEVDGAHDIPKLNKDLVKMFQYYANIEIDKGMEVDFWQKEVLSLIETIDTNNISAQESVAMNRLAFKAEQKIAELYRYDEYIADKFSYTKSPYGVMTTISSNFTSMYINNESEKTSLTERLYEITIPTLLIWGKYDFVTPSSLGQDAYNLISSEEKNFYILNNSGHSVMINEPNRFTKLIIDFINP